MSNINKQQTAVQIPRLCPYPLYTKHSYLYSYTHHAVACHLNIISFHIQARTYPYGYNKRALYGCIGIAGTRLM